MRDLETPIKKFAQDAALSSSRFRIVTHEISVQDAAISCKAILPTVLDLDTISLVDCLFSLVLTVCAQSCNSEGANRSPDD